MSGPSKEAREKAAEIIDADFAEHNTTPLEARIAAALQELMDGWDEALARASFAAGTAEGWKQRAEAAEAKLAECVRRVREWHRARQQSTHIPLPLDAILAAYAPKPDEPPA